MTSFGVCGKRVGYIDIFGSSSETSSKKRKCCSYEPLTTQFPEFGYGSNEAVSCLLQKFPALDPELVKRVLRDHNYEIDGAIESLGRISVGYRDASERSQSSESATIGNCDVTCNQMSEQDVNSMKTTSSYQYHRDASKWVDLIVQQILSAADTDDARRRTAVVLESFERNVTACSRVSEELAHTSLKEHLQCLLDDNQILKRAVSIQHDRGLEQEEKMKELQNVKLVLSHYQEQIRCLKLNNYALKLDLQRSREGNSFLQFPPDIC